MLLWTRSPGNRNFSKLPILAHLNLRFAREETASQKIDLRLRAMARVAEHKAVRWSRFTLALLGPDLEIQDTFGRVSSEIPTLEEQGSKVASELGQKEEEG